MKYFKKENTFPAEAQRIRFYKTKTQRELVLMGPRENRLLFKFSPYR